MMGIKSLSTILKKEQLQSPDSSTIQEEYIERESINHVQYPKKESDVFDEFDDFNLDNIEEEEDVDDDDGADLHHQLNYWDILMPWDGNNFEEAGEDAFRYLENSTCMVEDGMKKEPQNAVLQLQNVDDKKLSLNLSLNYQDVLDAWSDRTPWAHDSSFHTPNNPYMGEVPVMEEDRKRREASVLRYKEKRQTRLFSKKIRYQVRKLNADKRPRLKGRFVKRVADKIFK